MKTENEMMTKEQENMQQNKKAKGTEQEYYYIQVL